MMFHGVLTTQKSEMKSVARKMLMYLGYNPDMSFENGYVPVDISKSTGQARVGRVTCGDLIADCSEHEGKGREELGSPAVEFRNHCRHIPLEFAPDVAVRGRDKNGRQRAQGPNDRKGKELMATCSWSAMSLKCLLTGVDRRTHLGDGSSRTCRSQAY